MDKVFPGFVSYGGPGTSTYTYCATTPTPTTDDGAATELQPLDPQYVDIQITPPQQQTQNRVKQELQEENNQQSAPQAQPAPSLNTAETQTYKQPLADELPIDGTEPPYFAQMVQDVSIAFIDEQNTKERKLATQLAIRKANRGRNKAADPKSWTSNVRKSKHQRGEAYVSRRGKFVPERSIKTSKDCRTSCKLHCSQHLSETDRQHIFKAFYSLSSNEKKHFLLNTTERHCTKRPTKMRDDDEPKRKYSFKYFFLVRAVRYNVCKAFYLGTLAISQKPIYNVHAYKSDMNLPKPDGRGMAPASSHAIPAERKDRVRAHIAAFPVADSGGTAPNRRRYLDGNLSVKKMHYMYVEQCQRDGIQPVKESMYRKIFNTDFNLHFKKTSNKKVERCENCKHPIKRKSH